MAVKQLAGKEKRDKRQRPLKSEPSSPRTN
jgi:hypothetical protein